MKVDANESSHPVIFVTGGAGYIGSHFLEHWGRVSSEYFEKHQVVVLDNLSTGHIDSLLALNEENRKNYNPEFIFEKVDLCDFPHLKSLFLKYRPKAVVHYAAKISVAESVAKPELYYRNNVEGSENLLLAMQESGCKKLVFSSTAAVYGNVESPEPISENYPVQPINPYGDSKLKIEQAIATATQAWGLQSIVFRYFNAAGASLSGMLGEWHEPETHLIPLLLESILSSESELKVFGNDYPTRDGTCVRDYIHVTDLAQAHILGLHRLLQGEVNEVETYNLGTQNGTTVLEVIETAKTVTGKPIRMIQCERRPGDASVLVASSKQFKKVSGWETQYSDMKTILDTAYVWQQQLHRLQRKN